jgi:elongation factor Ts
MITSEKIKNLRIKTGAGMMDCKKALEETDGEIDGAVDWLRKKGISTAQKKSVRNASEGLITISMDDNCASIIEINSETDFVARNRDFQGFCKRISNLVVEKKIKSISEINEIRMNDSSMKVKDELTSMVSKVGENLVIKRLKYISGSGVYVQKYIHNSANDDSGKIGVVLCYSCNDNTSDQQNFAKNICMHIAATDPKSMTSDNLDKSIVEREKNIFLEQMKDSGKPQEIVEKIIVGKINKFYEEVCLMEQFFVMENKVKIKDCINNNNKTNSNDFKIINFTLFKVGENV